MRFEALFDPERGSHLEIDRPQRPPIPASRFRAVCCMEKHKKAYQRRI